MKTKNLIANKLKDGHFWLGIISVAFILSALIIFAIDRINGSVSYEYIAAAMVCIYVAALCVFADLSSVRIKENKKYRVPVIICAAVEVAVFVFTILTIRKFAVTQNELNLLAEQCSHITEMTEEAKALYDAYIAKSVTMEGFYLETGIVFTLWWFAPFIVSLIRIKPEENVEEEKEKEPEYVVSD